MRRAVIIACEMIEDEVRLALDALAPEDRPPVIWVESRLHDRPELLKAALQRLVDRLDEGSATGTTVSLPTVRPGIGAATERSEEVQVGRVEEVLLALGFCGKGLQGLKAQHLTLVFPRVDDCISLLLNHGCTREDIPRDSRSYYLTRGWFVHNSSVTESFQDWIERFGPERAARLRKTMFTGYQRVGLIDTKAYDLAECIDQSRAYAEELELDHVIVPGSVQLLERLFRGERDSEIVVVPPAEAIGFSHLFASE
ncbi:MAG: DUF1638 domain-containing protein [Thermoleophilia bacterium]|nr:DUF1638 domain-containing protein [Thermoleophilia bacterium]